MSSLPPPQYVLISQCTLPTDDTSESSNNTLTHPQIHYQYADDPPTAIPMSLPSDAHVVYLDFDPSSSSQSQVRSASNSIVATGLAVSDAAGASTGENPHLYVVSTGELHASTSGNDPKLALHDYRERLSAARYVIGAHPNRSRLESGP
ncbi:unnamed protein product [Rhizoctonia solani]|uniref:Uncharacterized protein n=1 Tax=Rhizoctonia solani TaxID=456999 RepID=A0A8H3BGT5_9AGAM|nr:unnamed protein product [Rhizoctonia solani]